MLIDTHCHLNLNPLLNEWSTIINQANSVGVNTVIVPGVDITSSHQAVKIASIDRRIFASIGIHPKSPDTDINKLIKIASKPKVVAVGECGLDYHLNISPTQQLKLFQHQVKLAYQLQLPLIIHTREKEAMNDMLPILKYHQQPIVFHCFSGDLDYYLKIASLKPYIGVGGTITYPNNQGLRNTVCHIPLDRIILETDAPLLSPQPKRGQVNLPAYLPIIALKLAEVMHCSIEEVIKSTTNNAKRLFRL